MPFTSYTYMTDADALAIKAYLFSLAPVHAAARPNTLTFPVQSALADEHLVAARSTRTRASSPIRRQSAEWNRGAYIAEALAHCGECHTPRNLAFALDNRKKFAGAVTAGWHAFNISSDKGSGIGAWSDDELFAYLSTGHALGRGTASGPMGEAVDQSFSQMAPADIRALVAYLRSVPAVVSSDLPATIAPPAPASPKDGGATSDIVGKRVFEGACVSCHNWTGVSADHALRHDRRHACGERSDGHQCRSDRDLRHDAAHAAGRRLDAGLRRQPIPMSKSRRSPTTSPDASAARQSKITEKDVANLRNPE